MKLTTLDEDLNIHQKMEDEPNDVGGMSAQELKEKFDQAGLTIQKYLNEVHLPEEEEAAQETLSQAKTYAKDYTDQKVRGLGKGDMLMSVYDTKRRLTDVYEYAEAKANAVKEEVSSLKYMFAATGSVVLHNSRKDYAMPENIVDPRGLWDAETSQINVPPQAKLAVVHLNVIWGRQAMAQCTIDLKLDGETEVTMTGPVNSDGMFHAESMILPVPVEGKEKISLSLEAKKVESHNAQVRLLGVYVEFIM